MPGSEPGQSIMSPSVPSSLRLDLPIAVVDVGSLSVTPQREDDQDGSISARENFPTGIKTSVSLPINCGTVTRHMTTGSVLTMANQNTFWGLLIDGCFPATLTF